MSKFHEWATALIQSRDRRKDAPLYELLDSSDEELLESTIRRINKDAPPFKVIKKDGEWQLIEYNPLAFETVVHSIDGTTMVVERKGVSH